jgi:hypothetical protein
MFIRWMQLSSIGVRLLEMERDLIGELLQRKEEEYAYLVHPFYD